jgi:hypothetical protein
MKRDKMTDNLPVLLSALIYPGAGQFMQRRWVLGALFGLAFSAAFMALMALVIQAMYHNLGIVMEWSRSGLQEPLKPLPVRGIVAWFVAGVLIYIANLIDVVAAQRRLMRQRHSSIPLTGEAGPPES